MAVTFQKNTAQTVDEIASLDAEIASLKRIRTELMESIKSQGEGKYGGSEHYIAVNVRRAVTHPVTELKKLASRQWLKAHERVTESVTACVRGYNKSDDGSIILP